jgi:hypothetical protein
LRPPPPSGDVIVTARYERFTVTAKGSHMAYTLPVGMKITVEISYVDAAGNPAEVDDPGPIWDTANPTIVTITPDQADPTKCEIAAPSTTGSAQVTATADVDLGDGVKSLITTLDLTVVAGEAVAGQIDVIGTPEPIK